MVLFLGGISGLKTCYSRNVTLFLKLAICTVATFALIFGLVCHSFEDIFQVLHRVFPVARGLYEDKVANFWCASSVIIKWKYLMSLQNLVYLR